MQTDTMKKVTNLYGQRSGFKSEYQKRKLLPIKQVQPTKLEAEIGIREFNATLVEKKIPVDLRVQLITLLQDLQKKETPEKVVPVVDLLNKLLSQSPKQIRESLARVQKTDPKLYEDSIKKAQQWCKLDSKAIGTLFFSSLLPMVAADDSQCTKSLDTISDLSVRIINGMTLGLILGFVLVTFLHARKTKKHVAEIEKQLQQLLSKKEEPATQASAVASSSSSSSASSNDCSVYFQGKKLHDPRSLQNQALSLYSTSSSSDSSRLLQPEQV